MARAEFIDSGAADREGQFRPCQPCRSTSHRINGKSGISQFSGNIGEKRIEVRADAGHGGNDDHGNQRCNQAVLNGSYPVFFLLEFFDSLY